MDDIFVYVTALPVNEFVTPCADGYTVYINERLSRQERLEAYEHALRHIRNGDFDEVRDVQDCELSAHLIESGDG